MTRKPADLQYRVNDIPPKLAIIVNALQPTGAGRILVKHEA